MGHVKIREMIIKDIEEVFDLEKRCFTMPWSKESFFAEIQNNKFARYLILEIDGKIMGYGGMWKILDEGHITNIAVDPDARGKGYGNLLVEALLKRAEKEEIKRMTLEVRKSNEIAQNLYKKYGFEPCGVRPKYYQDNHEDAVIMWRENEF